MKAKTKAVTEVQTERSHFVFEADIGRFRQLLGGLVGAQSGLQHLDGVVHPLARLLVSIALRVGGTADGERPVVAGAISNEGVNDVEVRRVTGANQPIREIVRMRTAAFSGDRVDGFHAIRTHFVQTLGRQRHDLAFLDAWLQCCGDVLIDAVDHAGGDVQQRDFVVVLYLARQQHHLLAIANLDAFFLQCKQHRRFADIQTQRHVRHAFLLEDGFDLLCRLLEQSDVGTDRASHSGIAGKNVILVKPGAVEPVMACCGTEVPDPRVAGSGEQAVPDQLVASPLSDDGAGDVANVVLIETQHGAESGIAERLSCARETIAMQTLEIDALFKIDLRDAGRLKRTMPAVGRFEIVFVDRKELRLLRLLRHSMPPTFESSL